MKQKWRRPIRQIICILLCIAMLPLVNVSAENYGSAYYTLVQWSRQGTVFKAQDPDVGEMMVSCQITGDENEQLEIYVQDIADPAFEDFMVADYFVTRWPMTGSISRGCPTLKTRQPVRPTGSGTSMGKPTAI